MNVNTATEEPLSEKKKILVLFGSPHKKGFTAKLLDEFLQPLQNVAEIRVINAYESAIDPCTGCGYCEHREACSLRDCDELDALIRGADVIVVATPVYVLSFPAPLKAIIDRTQRYFSARFSLGIKPSIEKHKTAVLLVTSGSANSDGASIISRQLKMIFSVMNTSLLHEAVWLNTDLNRGEETFPAARDRAHQLALELKSEL